MIESRAFIEDRYRLDDEIGRGGMGVVHRGVQLALDRPVAIKRLLGATADDPSTVERFRREALAASRVAHPGIVAVFDAGVHAGAPYIVMEFVDGEPLDEAIERRSFAVDEALAIAWQLADVLVAAHDAGILHRDVKPGNVILGRDGRARLLDFGLATLRDQRDTRITRTGMVLGTPAYLAPEVACGADPDGRADLYALGILLYELLTGVVPYEGPTPVATVLAHLSAPFVPPSARRSEISAPVDDLVSRLIAREVTDRPVDARAARAAIERARADSSSPKSRARHTALPDLDAFLVGELAGDRWSLP